MELYGKNPGNTIAPHYLNLWASTNYWRSCELIADDFARASLETGLRWDILALFYWFKTDFNRKKNLDPFEIGFEGSAADQAINATLHVIDKGFKDVKELPITEDELKVFNLLVLRWEAASGLLLSRETQGNPLPVPPAPEEPKPLPPPVILTPKPDLPATPEVPAKKFSWAWAKTAAAILAGISVVAGLFIPGWAKTILDAIIAILRSLGAM
jgi:hypothetical protein